MQADRPTLSVALGQYPHTEALRSGRVASDRIRLEFADITPINRAFAPMVREARFDVSELAVATFLQAISFGKPLVLLPVVLAARFQETAVLCRTDSDIAGPVDLVGRRVGVRSYGQTTGMWVRGILADAYGVRPEQVTWVTFEGAHVSEYQDPPWATRAAPGEDMLALLRDGRLDAVIVGNDVPSDPSFRTVFPDPVAAGQAFRRRYGFVPVNHLLTVRRELARDRPDLVGELVRLMSASAAMAPPPGFQVVPSPEDLRDALAVALRFSQEQGLVSRALHADDVWEGHI